MEDTNNIEVRHRKEKKELQARIQALKKTIKGDKSKKKEVSAEIIKLEDELETRQSQELDVQRRNVECNNIDQTNNDCESKLKISKAQKRRDKKIQQEKDRELEIKLQEKENLHGPRNIEVQAIIARLKDKQLKLYSIPSDGDCLYKAVAHQLEITRDKIFQVEELRKKVAIYIRENKNDFLPFMSNPDTYEMLNDNEFEDYCEKISTTKAWGGQLEIRALSNCLQCPITVIQAAGPVSIDQGDEFPGPPLVITYHRHMYQLGEHYNSTEILKDDV